MKTITLSFLLAIFALTAAAQGGIPEKDNNRDLQTLFGKEVSHGGYGALMFHYTQINKTDAFIMGMRGGWMIDHVFTVGAGGYGFINNINLDRAIDGTYDFDLAGGYGGLLLEATLFPKSVVHLSFPLLIGAGGVAQVDRRYWSEYHWEYIADDADAFFVIEPAAELEVNIVKSMRAAFTVSYRYTRDINLENVDRDVLNTFNFGLVLKFGKF